MNDDRGKRRVATVFGGIGIALVGVAGRSGSEVVPCKTLGATLATIDLVEVAADATGHRTQFDPVPAGTAFEVWLDGLATIAAPEPKVAIVRVSDQEWDEYWQFLKKDAPPGQDNLFLIALLNSLLDQKTALLAHRDSLADVERRANAAIEKLKAGAKFNDVVQGNSEDLVSRQAEGLFLDSGRGSMIDSYPFSKAIFELGEHQITGPIYNKNAAYIVHVDKIEKDRTSCWFDRSIAYAITIRYTTGPNMNTRQISAIKAAARVRSGEERFKRLLPPGMQVPTPAHFGPEDVAPSGHPEVPLKRRHLDDDKDDKVPPAPTPTGGH